MTGVVGTLPGVQATEGGSTAAESQPRGGLRLPCWVGNRAVGVAVAVLVLLSLSFLNDPAGYLGTDTGGKTATLAAMVDRGDWSADVGYWAQEHDPSGAFHPMFGTRRTDEGWIQVTTLPMVLAARPLYEMGGYRATLLLPIAGTALAALAGAALAERLGSRMDGTRAFWVLVLGSPLVVYALDLWEHSLGVAAIAWAVVLLYDAVGKAGSPTRGLGAGALLAAAATMRTEALVYAVVLVFSACLYLVVRRQIVAAVGTGLAAVAGFAPVWSLNSALEGLLGGMSRTARATGAAAAGATATADQSSDLGLRLEEGLRTTFATAATPSWLPVAIGFLLAVTVAGAVRAGCRIPARRVPLLAAGLASLTVFTLASGLGFVPGLFAAFPIAAASFGLRGAACGRGWLIGAASAALPVVWAFQFTGGAGPQWAGRYVLPSTLMLGVVGVVAVGRDDVPRALRSTVIGMSVVVNVFGLAWLAERSHEVDRLFTRIEAVQEEALIARNHFILRESGPRVLGQRWLSAASPAALDGPADVLRSAGVNRFSVLQVDGQPVPKVEDAVVIGADRVAALGVVFEVVHLRFQS